MKNTPIDYDIVNETIDEMSIPDFGKATIREGVAIASRLEEKTGQEFIHMEMGVPGLPPAAVGVEAEIEALRNGVASIYPVIDGLPRLKKEAARFVKAFIDVDVDPQGCVPVVGSMQGTFTSFLVAGQCNPEKDTILFIDPGFPVQKQQIVVLGYKYEAFDVYDFRGDKLREKLESYLEKGNIAAVIYSNPNNPSWICLKDEELRTIGDLANKYDVIVSNPPYIKREVIKKLNKDVQKEPIIALDGGYDGLDFYRKIINESEKYLKFNGYLCFEIGYDQKEDVIGIIKNKERYINTYSKKDLYGNDRIIITKLS